MAFWSMRGSLSMASATEKVLDRPDFTLADLLSCDDILNHVLMPNDRIMQYLCQHDVIAELVQYAIAPPSDSGVDSGDAAGAADEGKNDEHDARAPAGSERDLERDIEREGSASEPVESLEPDEPLYATSPDPDSESSDDEDAEEERNRRLRFAKIATEILTTDVWNLLDVLLANESAMGLIWDLLGDDSQRASAQQLAMITRILEGLLEKRLDKLLNVIRALPHFVDYFIRYIECQPFIDFLIKVISTDHPEGPTDIIGVLYDQNLIPKMVELLRPEIPHSAQSAAGDFLKAFVNISGGNKSDICAIGPNELSRQFVTQECMERLIELMLKGGHGMCVAVAVIIEIIRKNNSDYDVVEVMNTTVESHPPNPRDNIYLGTMVKLFAKAIPKFQAMLVAPETRMLKMPFGEVKPLGFERFRICELYAELLHCSNMNLLNDPNSEAVIRERDEYRMRMYHPDQYAQDKDRNAQDVMVGIENTSVGPSSEPTLGNSGAREIEQSEAQAAVVDTTEGSDPSARRLDNEADQSTAEPDSDVLEGHSSSGSVSSADSSGTHDSLDDFTEPLTKTQSHVPGLDDASETDSRSTSGSGEAAHYAATDAEEDKRSFVPQSPPLDNISPPASPADTSLDSSPLATPEDDSGEEIDFQEAASTTKISISPLRGAQLEEALESEAAELRKDPVAGDMLKIALDEEGCINAVFDMLFEFPWNNFLHNVVFDIVQQVFNGYFDHGYNKFLAIHLFTRGQITTKIVDGQFANSDHQQRTDIRLGYVGHLTLVSEEVVKFESMFLPESLSPVVAKILQDPVWVIYTNGQLVQLREQYNTVLGKVSLMSDEEETFDIGEDQDSKLFSMELDLSKAKPSEKVARMAADIVSDSDSESDTDSENDSQDDDESYHLDLAPQPSTQGAEYNEPLKTVPRDEFEDVFGYASEDRQASQGFEEQNTNDFSRYMSGQLGKAVYGDGDDGDDSEEDLVENGWIPVPGAANGAEKPSGDDA